MSNFCPFFVYCLSNFWPNLLICPNCSAMDKTWTIACQIFVQYLSINDQRLIGKCACPILVQILSRSSVCPMFVRFERGKKFQKYFVQIPIFVHVQMLSNVFPCPKFVQNLSNHGIHFFGTPHSSWVFGHGQRLDKTNSKYF